MVKKTIEQRVADIEESLARAHRTGIEVGAAVAALPRIICEAIPDAKSEIERQLEMAIDSADGKPALKVVLQGALDGIRR